MHRVKAAVTPNREAFLNPEVGRDPEAVQNLAVPRRHQRRTKLLINWGISLILELA